MGTAVQISSASFSKYVAQTLPYRANAFAHYLFGGTLADSLANLVGPTNATQVGTLIINSNSIGTDFGIGLDTGLTYADDFTFCAVTERALGAGLGGTYWGGATEDNFQMGTTGFTVRGFANGDTGHPLDTPSAPDVGKFHFYCLTKTGTAAKLYYWDGTALVAISATVTAKATAVPNVRIGGLSTLAPSPSYPAKLAAWAGYSVGLTAGQILDVRNYMKAKCGDRGVVVY